ncbi:hypothetical protein [Hymenobacter cellulosilyticus]|uniref:Uncharacterized protein n=1 Tax=Hymenobacter cellulosilyticus TaxID=2932248 RepID=A0A8T9Q1K4_9BACT|nr:hypothetical protein [Hymenobacter cellulosilyticus]UOQ70782.1 hypothetical protein MUN79_19105 [Hymenobacter cellulosilyticus]
MFIIVCLGIGKWLNKEDPKWSVPVLLVVPCLMNAFLLVHSLLKPPLTGISIDSATGTVVVSRWLRSPQAFELSHLTSGFGHTTVKGVKHEYWALADGLEIVVKVTPMVDGWLRKDLAQLNQLFGKRIQSNKKAR